MSGRFKDGERVMLSPLGIEMLKDMRTGSKGRYGATSRGTVNGYDEHGSVLVLFDSRTRGLPVKAEYLQLVYRNRS